MKRINDLILNYYNEKVVGMIIEKYGIQEKEAMRRFICSVTHEMMENEDMAMYEFPERAIFEIWETEMVTGDPRNSFWLRSEQ